MICKRNEIIILHECLKCAKIIYDMSRDKNICAALRRGVGGSLNPKSAICGAEIPPEAFRVGKRLPGRVMKVGSHATGAREPGQAREGAAISGISRAPWGSPAGARKGRTPRSGSVDGGRAAHIFPAQIFTEILISLVILTIVFAIAIKTVTDFALFTRWLAKEAEDFMDFIDRINFILNETAKRQSRGVYECFNENRIGFYGISNGAEKLIEYYIIRDGEECKLYRKADGEGNNLLLTANHLKFTQYGSMVILEVDDYKFFIPELNLPDYPSNSPEEL